MKNEQSANNNCLIDMVKTDEKTAWEAIDRGDFSVAAEIWEKLISSCSNAEKIDSLEHGYGYALVVLKRWDEARAIYQRLYQKTESHIYVHQIGMVEREAGNYKEAAALFKQEQTMLLYDDNLAKAANLYEQGLIESLMGNHDLAIPLANKCLDLAMATDDKIMHGCAYRLLGDLSCDDHDTARIYYDRSRNAFNEAGDKVACDEIDERLKEIT